MSGMEPATFSTMYVDNFTVDSQTTPYVSLMEEIYSTAQFAALVTIFAIFMIFGMVANAVTFVVIYRMKKTAFNVFIMSLCVSDFLSAFNSPLIVYRAFKAFDDYGLPEFFCKLGLSIDYWTSISTIQHILTFSFLRFYCIKFPHNFTKITVRRVLLAVAFIWTETFFFGFLIYAMWPGVRNLPGTYPPRNKCGMTREWAPIMFRYAMIAFPILIYAPMIAIILTCAGICLVLMRRKKVVAKERTRKEKFALIQLALIVVSFLLGYSVDVSYRVTAISSIQRGDPITARTEVIYSTISHIVLRLSECLNPVFYNFASSDLRTATKKFLFGEFSVARSSRVTNSDDPHTMRKISTISCTDRNEHNPDSL